jgi:hypothetical protein
MQAWYKDGLLPIDLPVRREGETEYVLLKDLRQQCVDPTHPFRSPPVTAAGGNANGNAQGAVTVNTNSSSTQGPTESLLPPISLLAQPKHFGPPALFFSSRGGHSTAIVDARGRSVLKGRFLWSQEEKDVEVKTSFMGRMGDIRRIEAFDVQNRSILVAMRQGGLEAVDLGDALLKPADESRTMLPSFDPSPSNVNRRKPFVWRIGTPVSVNTGYGHATGVVGVGTVLSSKKPGMLLGGHLSGKKMSSGPSSSKSPNTKTEFSHGGGAGKNGEGGEKGVGSLSGLDGIEDSEEEVLFLGRKGDEMYLCERNAGFFRILCLCPMNSSMD